MDLCPPWYAITPTGHSFSKTLRQSIQKQFRGLQRCFILLKPGTSTVVTVPSPCNTVFEAFGSTLADWQTLANLVDLLTFLVA